MRIKNEILLLAARRRGSLFPLISAPIGYRKPTGGLFLFFLHDVSPVRVSRYLIGETTRYNDEDFTIVRGFLLFLFRCRFDDHFIEIG